MEDTELPDLIKDAIKQIKHVKQLNNNAFNRNDDVALDELITKLSNLNSTGGKTRNKRRRPRRRVTYKYKSKPKPKPKSK